MPGPVPMPPIGMPPIGMPPVVMSPAPPNVVGPEPVPPPPVPPPAPGPTPALPLESTHKTANDACIRRLRQLKVIRIHTYLFIVFVFRSYQNPGCIHLLENQVAEETSSTSKLIFLEWRCRKLPKFSSMWFTSKQTYQTRRRRCLRRKEKTSKTWET